MKIISGKDIGYVPASHENPEAPGVLKKILLCKDDFMDGRAQMLNWALLPEGNSFQPHYHEDMQETFVVMRGRAKIAADAEEAVLEAGDAVIIPAGSIHRMENIGCGDVEYIALGISLGRGGRTVVV